MEKIKEQKHGIRQAEMKESILQLKKTIDGHTAKNKEVFVFTIFGEQDEFVNIKGESDDSGFPLLWATQDKQGRITPAELLPNAYAKIVYSDRTKYYIKTNGLGKFFNPMGMYSENRHNKILKHAGKEEWQFKEVNLRAFEFYLKFLKGRVVSNLLNAERESI